MKPTDEPQVTKAGYLVLRLRQGDGVFIHESIEIRIAQIKVLGEVQIAIRAPKEIQIRKVR